MAISDLRSQLLIGITAAAEQSSINLDLGRTLELRVAELLPDIRPTGLELDALLRGIRSQLREANLTAVSSWRGSRDEGELAVDVQRLRRG